jgi:hypothetical protein
MTSGDLQPGKLASGRFTAGKGGAFFNLRDVAGVVFFQPQLLLLLAHDRWTRAFRIVALLSFFCGVILGALQVPALISSARAWGEWFGREMGEVRLEQGQLQWQRPVELPHTSRHGNWRVDFRGADAEFAPQTRLGPERKGIWISPDAVYTWWRLPGSESTHSTVWLNEQRLFGLLDVNRVWPEGLHLREDEFAPAARQTVLRAVPVYVLGEGVRVLLQVAFYTLIFAVIPYLLKSPLAAGGFRSVLTFYLYASIAPIIVATVYAALGLPFMDFNSFFVTAFILYLLFTVWRMGRFFRPQPEKAEL